MDGTTFGVGPWARLRTAELVDHFRAHDQRPLDVLTSSELSTLNAVAGEVIALLRSHTSDCIREAVAVGPHVAETGEHLDDLRQVKDEIDAAIAQLSDVRAQIGVSTNGMPLAPLPVTPVDAQSVPKRPEPEQSAPQPSPQELPANEAPEQEIEPTAKDRISELEKQRREGLLSDAQFATALRATLLRVRA